MRNLERRILAIAFALVVGLLSAVAPAQAQDTVTNNYAAKFICGVQPDANINSNPDAQAGRYSTKINVHNNTGLHIVFRKKVIQLKGGQEPTEPSFRRIERLPPDWAMEVVCRDIYSHLNIQLPVDKPPPYIEGFVIFEVLFGPTTDPLIPDDPLDVAGIYTYRGEYPVIPGHALTHGVSIDVVVYPAKRNRHTMTK